MQNQLLELLLLHITYGEDAALWSGAEVGPGSIFSHHLQIIVDVRSKAILLFFYPHLCPTFFSDTCRYIPCQTSLTPTTNSSIIESSKIYMIFQFLQYLHRRAYINPTLHKKMQLYFHFPVEDLLYSSLIITLSHLTRIYCGFSSN